MGRVAWCLCVAAGLSVLTPAPFFSGAASAVAVEKADPAGDVAGLSAPASDSAEVELRFVQEGGPESGHVRVLLTPSTRPLNLFEARSAAQQAFLVALKEPGLGDDLSRITVVVRLAPGPSQDGSEPEQIFRFQHKGGQDWAVLPGE